MRHLTSSILTIKDLLPWQKDQMFQLMDQSFDGMDRETFNQDLNEKQSVIILTNGNPKDLKGFSTFMILENLVVDGVNISAVFSGDTIINPQYWGCWELFQVFGQLTFDLIDKYAKENSRFYWFLVSMGYKTYRMLPLFYKEFYPRYNKSTPTFEKKVIDVLGKQKFPLSYDSAKGIIHFPKMRERLKSDLAKVSEEKLKNPNVRYFIKSNPFYYQGDEVACITRLSKDNYTLAGKRMLKK